MEREKMIEEMAKDLAQCCAGNRLTVCKDDIDCSRCRAEWLSKYNYCKVPDGAVVLTKEELESGITFNEVVKSITREETAREILGDIIDRKERFVDSWEIVTEIVTIEEIKSVAREYGVEVE